MPAVSSRLTLTRLTSGLLMAVLGVFSCLGTPASASGQSQGNDPAAMAETMLAGMTPEERVGQLFLVTFTGTSADASSAIQNLIVQYHIGGVVLRADNDNFAPAPDTLERIYQLISQLQTTEWESSGAAARSSVNGTATPESPGSAQNYIPLFVGLFQAGDGYPSDQILSGVTPLPTLMALGAAWDPELARQVGSVAGQELSQLGVNLFFGPALDVSESPESTLTNNLGAGVFSGDPYWAGLLGSAYIEGLHSGSGGRLVVVVDHFPGRGSSDRPSGQEAATVRKSLEQLKQIELAPYVYVTGNATSPGSTADGLLVSHIRYQGFQGNIRATTRPVSFDPQALTQIMSLPSFSTWHIQGGLLVSDDLGSQTVRNFYDPSGLNFTARLVARDAFLAGNDLLNLGNILSSDGADTYHTVIRIAEFFTQKYQEDPVFKSRVDTAVLRILTIKYRTYGEFDPSLVTPSENGLAAIGRSQAVTFEVARNSATLVSPGLSDLEAVISNPPDVHDYIVFLTDSREGRQCSTCIAQPMMAVDALQSAILRLYGPQAGGQAVSGRLISYSLDALAGILSGGNGNPDLEAYLKQADWVVVNMLEAEPGQSQTTLLRRFLSERQDLLRDKHLIVFAFNAPYFLDATDISKLTAYYCLYSKSDPFIEVAARLLFRELPAVGSLPVSVPGIGYDLLSATAPDPNQVIGLYLENPTGFTPTTVQTSELSPGPVYRIGDTLAIRTDTILDHNGHSVPDGTGVSFYLGITGETGFIQQSDTVTSAGAASAQFKIEQAGIFEIRAESEPALTSVVLQMDVTEDGGVVTVLAPTQPVTPTSLPETDGPAQAPQSAMQQGYPGFGGWFFSILFLSGIGLLAARLAIKSKGVSRAALTGLATFTGGLVSFTYLAIKLPGSIKFLLAYGWLGLAGILLVGALVGFATVSLWNSSTQYRRSPRRKNE